MRATHSPNFDLGAAQRLHAGRKEAAARNARYTGRPSALARNAHGSGGRIKSYGPQTKPVSQTLRSQVSHDLARALALRNVGKVAEAQGEVRSLMDKLGKIGLG